jgi:hypothetical protein
MSIILTIQFGACDATLTKQSAFLFFLTNRNNLKNTEGEGGGRETSSLGIDKWNLVPSVIIFMHDVGSHKITKSHRFSFLSIGGGR